MDNLRFENSFYIRNQFGLGVESGWETSTPQVCVKFKSQADQGRTTYLQILNEMFSRIYGRGITSNPPYFWRFYIS